jgi:hypothetical protein
MSRAIRTITPTPVIFFFLLNWTSRLNLPTGLRLDQGPLNPWTGGQLLIENQFIPSGHHRKLHTRGDQRLIPLYVKQKHQLADADVSHFHWDSPVLAISVFQYKSQNFLLKVLSEWLPVGKKSNVTTRLHIPVNVHGVSVELKTLTKPSAAQTGGDGELLADRSWFSSSNTNPVLTDLLLNGLHH